MNPSSDSRDPIVLGQKYAFATASLICGIACYVNLLGLEKGVLAIVFAWMALKDRPSPRLTVRRGWAQAGLAMGTIPLVVIPVVLALNFDRLHRLLNALIALQTGK